jgi:hypothetical protein
MRRMTVRHRLVFRLLIVGMLLASALTVAGPAFAAGNGRIACGEIIPHYT